MNEHNNKRIPRIYSKQSILLCERRDIKGEKKMMSYADSRNIVPLTAYFDRKIAETSKESRILLSKDTVCALMLELYRSSPSGFSDEEMQFKLREKGLWLPKSSVSARRNDIKGSHSQPLIVDCGERRKSRCDRTVIVWKLNQYTSEV